MALFLVQHGKCLSKEQDPEQALSREGIRETTCIADEAKHYGITVSAIEHSLKKRARQTANIFAAALAPVRGVRQKVGLKPMDDVHELAKRVDPGANIMLVGHLPFMERLTAYLTAGVMGKTVFKFQNSGILCLDRDPGMGSWYIKWSLMPHIT